MKIIFVILAASFALQAEDVYNFYFQKAQGTNSVIQGGGIAPTPNPEQFSDSKVSETSIITVPQGPPSQTNEHYSVITFGYAYSGRVNESYTVDGAFIGFERRFLRYLGVYASLQWTRAEFWYNWDYNPVTYGYDRPHGYGMGGMEGSMGLSLSPLQIKLFDHGLIEIGGVAGAMYANSAKVKNNNPDGVSGDLFFYYGARMTLNFTESLGLSYEGRIGGNEHTQQTLGLIVRI